MYQVNWESGEIYIPQSDLTYLSAGKYKLGLIGFKNKCRNLSANPLEGLSYPPIIEYKESTDTGDVIIASVVLLINGYTVTFEDGQYAVLFDGANTNVHNNTNVNQVSVRPNNSTGLQDLSTLLSSAYGGEVVINIATGQAGTSTPIGTLGKPSNNITDTLTIADNINAKEINLQGSLTLDTGDDVSYRIIVGSHPLVSNLVVNSGADTIGLIAKNILFNGTLDGDAILEHCVLGEVRYFNGYINDCALTSSTIFINGIGLFMNCRAGATCVSPPIIDLAEADGLGIRDYVGDLIIKNKIGIGACKIHINGELTIDETCTVGSITVYGDGYVTDNSTGNFTLIDRTTGTPTEIATAVWDYIIPSHQNEWVDELEAAWVDETSQPWTTI